jgi:translation initiation factor eIF-2B subunit delta
MPCIHVFLCIVYTKKKLGITLYPCLHSNLEAKLRVAFLSSHSQASSPLFPKYEGKALTREKMTSVSSVPSTSTQNPPIIQPSAPPDAPPQRKQLTKAERRELQEKQRAAKAAAAASGSTGKSQANAAKPSNPKAQTGQHSKVTMPVGATSSIAAISTAGGAKKTAKSGKDADVVLGTGTLDKAAELEAHRKHQTRIFTHFVVPKKEGKLGVGIKGEIHPAIVRLGRQFADMKIVGANARCIATLVAFKTVCDYDALYLAEY